MNVEADEDGTEEPAEAEFAFALERELRDFIAHDIRTVRIGDRTLPLFVDSVGRTGVEYRSDVVSHFGLKPTQTSLSVVFNGASDGDDGPSDLGSAAGWRAFAAWAGSLLSKFDAIRSLADDGRVN